MTHPKPWNRNSVVCACPTCEGTGGVSNGRGLGGNDPDSWDVPCEDCGETGICACEVCGFDVPVAGVDCLACQTVYEIADRDLTDETLASLQAAIAVAFDVARKNIGTTLQVAA